MVLLRLLLFISLTSFFFSCAKVQYIWEQGQGQMGLMNKARPNEEIFKDVRVLPLYKEKVQKIEQYKKFFFDYFKLKPTDIYSKTTLLDREAVTYLRIASPYDVIKAKEECFPFVGCFPYLGYFSKSSAQEAAKKLEEENWITWIRPVYAYSTLGHFTDPILSSFFTYSDYDLAEMIFHELFHTIFWVKDEVELNENLAVYFSENLAIQYFKLEENKKKEVLNKKKNYDDLMKFVLAHIEKINAQYALLKNKQNNKKYYQDYLNKYLEDYFKPELEAKCKTLGYDKDKCWPLKRNWNNASFAALLTYQARGENILILHQKLRCDLKDFYLYLQKRYDNFKNEDQNSFAQYLFGL